MRLPHYLIESPFFVFSSLDELERGLAPVDEAELSEVRRLAAGSLPPATSEIVLATMLGVNPGMLWSLIYRTDRHYRTFNIPKGQSVREIKAPKVFLKIIQKWLAFHFSSIYQAPRHVYGFVSGKSHIDAAVVHLGARWVYSVDIENFFSSTPQSRIEGALQDLGYQNSSAAMLATLFCLRGVLPQGAPSSPVLSNLAFLEVDSRISACAEDLGIRVTRYADDITFSGDAEFPEQLCERIPAMLQGTPWRLADHKTRLDVEPARRKVHGLLVMGDKIRLTKGYRNRIRAFEYLIARGGIKPDDIAFIKGHLNYSAQVRSRSV